MYAATGNLVAVVQKLVEAHASLTVLTPPPDEMFSATSGKFQGGRETLLHLASTQGARARARVREPLLRGCRRRA